MPTDAAIRSRSGRQVACPGGYTTSVGLKETITWSHPSSGGTNGVHNGDGGHSYGLYATMPSKICLKDTWTVSGVSAGSSWSVNLPAGISYTSTSTTKSVHMYSCLTGYKSINHYWSANQVRYSGNVTSLTHTTTVTVYRNNNLYTLTTLDKDVP